MTKWIAHATRSPGDLVRLAPLSFALVSASVLAPDLSGAASLEAQQPAPAGPRFTIGVLPYLGVSATPREARLPVSPLAGLRLTGNVWTRVSSRMRVGTYLGVDGGAVAVHESCVSGSCARETEMQMSYLATAYGGVTTDVPGLPHFFVFVGRAFPRNPRNFDPGTRAWGNDRPLTWGAGGGLVVAVGNQPFHLEGRFRRDLRYDPTEHDSFEFIMGVPLASVGRRP